LHFHNLEEVEEERISPGVKRKIITGKDLMFVLYEIAPNQGLAMHKHPHEQLGYILEGEAEFIIGEEKTVMKAGTVFHVPPNVIHGGKVIGEQPLIELDVFHPIREDFLKKPEKK